MRFPDKLELATGLLAIGIAFTGCSKNVPPVDATKAARPSAPMVPVPLPTTVVMSEKRIIGAQLERLDFSRFPGTRLESKTIYEVDGVIRVWSIAQSSDVILNPNKLSAISAECELTKVGKGFNIQVKDIHIDEKTGEESALDVSSSATTVSSFIGIRKLLEETEGDLARNFEVDPKKRDKATETLAGYHMSRLVAEGICGAAISNRRYGSSELTQEQLTDVMREVGKMLAPYRNKLFTGQDAPILRVVPKSGRAT